MGKLSDFDRFLRLHDIFGCLGRCRDKRSSFGLSRRVGHHVGSADLDFRCFGQGMIHQWCKGLHLVRHQDPCLEHILLTRSYLCLHLRLRFEAIFLCHTLALKSNQ